MDDIIINFFRNEYFYEVLSISKSVVGLAFLESVKMETNARTDETDNQKTVRALFGG